MSSDENDEDRAIREAKEANKRRKSEQKAEARREKKVQKEVGMLCFSNHYLDVNSDDNNEKYSV